MKIIVVGFILGCVSQISVLHAGEINIVVSNPDGDPVENAIVSATHLASTVRSQPGIAGNNQPASTPHLVTISQENKQFTPLVTAVEVGTAISFPNRDNILHNVYSFSKAKKFQLPLYKDEPPEPVVFDRPGKVILGCNIHDWMVAYVYVLETPYFDQSDAQGQAILADLPAGKYEVRVRHPSRRNRGSSPPKKIDIGNDSRVQLTFTVVLKPQWRPQQVP